MVDLNRRSYMCVLMK